jgi:hypothetical protein
MHACEDVVDGRNLHLTNNAETSAVYDYAGQILLTWVGYWRRFAAVLVNVSLMRSWRKIIPELKGITAYGSSKANISILLHESTASVQLAWFWADLRISQAE